jgi:hypothetical protein
MDGRLTKGNRTCRGKQPSPQHRPSRLTAFGVTTKKPGARRRPDPGTRAEARGLRWEPADKPGSVENGHSSGTPVTRHLKRPTRGPRGPRVAAKAACPPIWSCSGWGLPCRRRYRRRGALLPHHFTLTAGPRGPGWRYLFCGTFRRLTPPRRYLASRPTEPGLSSAPQGRDHLADSLTRSHSSRRRTCLLTGHKNNRKKIAPARAGAAGCRYRTA